MNIFNKLLRQSALLLGAGLTLQAPGSFAARCEYLVQSDWNTGFVAAIRITNDTNTAINGWSVNWAYSDGSTRTGGWNANFSGSNPYSATGVGWNNQINPGQSVEFGVQGNKGVANSPAQRPVVTGTVCSNAPGSSSSSSTSRSVITSAFSSSRMSISSSSMSSRSRSSYGLSLSSSSIPSSSASATSSRPTIPSSSSASSVEPNTPPVAVLDVTVHGMTVFIDGSKSTDAEGPISYKIYTGDPEKPTIFYPSVWNTYQTPGEYSVTLEIWDRRGATVRVSKKFTVQPVAGNQAPIAMISAARENRSIVAYATASFDPEGVPLSYEWDFGNGAYIGDARTSFTDCLPDQTTSQSALVTVTVSDGELKDTRQITAGGLCGTVFDVFPQPQFTYRLEGNKIYVDGRKSTGTTGLSWDFGDGSARVAGVLAEHTYAAAGTYTVELGASGQSLFGNRTTQIVTLGSASSLASSSLVSSSARSATVCPGSSAGATSAAACPAPSSSARSSSVASSSAPSSLAISSASSVSSIPNHYNAPRATTAPVIDGNADVVWERTAWAPIDVFWLGTQSNPSAQDYSGRYKALWDEDYLYLLFDVTDDRIYDGVRDALDRYWEDDTVELFIDENKNGGQHGYNTGAWAYHISTYGDVVDYTTSGPKLLNDHVTSRLVSNGSKHSWELRVRIYGEDYADWKANTPLKLFSGKLMGFSACYIDNDGSPQRESMMGSVNTQGHKNNQGYQDASVFGSLRLVE